MDDCSTAVFQFHSAFAFTYLAVVEAAAAGAGTTLAGRGFTDLCI